MVLRGVLFS